MRLIVGYKAWKEQEYLLNRMSLRDLVRAYITYPAIQAYVVLSVLAGAAAIFTATSVWTLAASVGAAVLLYPLAWYMLHRFVLHGAFMYKSQLTAKLWKRVHYDHHRYPNDLSVLFGGLHTTLPTIVVITGTIGLFIGGYPGALAAIAAGLVMTCVYEFWHCGQHLAFEPKSKFWRRIKKLHLAHHFHNEHGNYGITNFFVDRIFGTLYEDVEATPRSPTARNLGYTDETAKTYPWVKEISDIEDKKFARMRSSAA